MEPRPPPALAGIAVSPSTDLELSRYSPAYRRRLADSFEHFRDWIRQHSAGGEAQLLRPTAKRMDGLLAAYTQHCFDHNVNFSIPKHAALAAQQIYHLRQKLPRAWNCLWSWKHRLPTQHRLPIPLDFVRAAFTVALNMAFSHRDGGLYLALAVLIRIGFYGLLRPSEMYNLRAGDVLVRNSPDGLIAVVVLREPKNRRSLGSQQFATLRDSSTVRLLAWLIEGLHADHRLWPSTPTRFRTIFAEVMQNCGLGHLKASPGCLRPGGATHLFLEGVEVSRLQFLGRWVSVSSLNHYIQESMSLLVWIRLDNAERLRLEATCRIGLPFWSTPPSLPLAAFAHLLPSS